MSAIDHIFTVWQALFVVIFVFLPFNVYGATVRYFLRSRSAERETETPRRPQVITLHDGEDAGSLAVPGREQENGQLRELRIYRDLYFKLHNLEQFTEILPRSRDLLISLFAKTLADAHTQSEPGILSVEQYSREGLISFLQTDSEKTTREWELYMARRAAGAPAEMFVDKEEAKWWLRQIAPVK